MIRIAVCIACLALSGCNGVGIANAILFSGGAKPIFELLDLGNSSASHDLSNSSASHLVCNDHVTDPSVDCHAE